MTRMIALLGTGLMIATLGCSMASAAERSQTDDINAVPAGQYRLDPLHSKITWRVDHYGFSHYEGQFVDLSGMLRLNDEVDQSRVTIELPLAEVLTGSALSEHLQSEKFFNSSQFPKATFKSTDIDMTGDDTAEITGDLTLHGRTHPLTIDATFNQAAIYPFDKNYRLGFDGTATLKRSDYGITALLPGDDGPGIIDEVQLEITAEFLPQ